VETKTEELLRKIQALPLKLDESYRLTLYEEINACVAEYSHNDVLLKKCPAMETCTRFLDDDNKTLFSRK
jgi:hypothetical protein